MSHILELARDLGRALARTDEFQALRRAVGQADDDREMVETRNRLSEITGLIEQAIRSGKDPEAEVAEEYEALFGRLQSYPGYQRLVSAQANFDKVMARVNQTIEEGMQDGAQGRIILSP